jgi:hypothetical protein
MSDIEATTAKTRKPRSGAKHPPAKSPSPPAPANPSSPKRLAVIKGPKAQKVFRPTKQNRKAREGSKQDLVIQMLRRQSGVTIEDIVGKTSWQAHSVRGFLSGLVKKKLKLPLVSNVGKDGVRRYHIAPLASTKA